MTPEIGLNIENIPWIFSGLGVIIISGLFTFLKHISGFITNSMCLGIAGDYNIFIDNSEYSGPHGQVELKQFFGWIWGTFTISVTESGNNSRTLQYKHKGIYTREQAILKFRELGKDKRIVGSTVLKVLGRGEKVMGCNSFWNHTHEEGGFRIQYFHLKRINA